MSFDLQALQIILSAGPTVCSMYCVDICNAASDGPDNTQVKGTELAPVA